MSGYLIFCLFAVGIYGLVACRNLVKKIVALNIINSSVVLLFMYTGSLDGTLAPILVGEAGSVVDPVPQAFMLTAIVVGICITALGLCLAHRLYREYGTLDIVEIQRMRAREHA